MKKLMTYQQANTLAKQNKGIYYEFDAGQGWKGGVHFCERRNRLVYVSFNPEGIMI